MASKLLQWVLKAKLLLVWVTDPLSFARKKIITKLHISFFPFPYK